MSDDSAIEFGFHEFDAETLVKERNLPHWFQPGAATFITFRTADSLPRDVCLRMQRELQQWLADRSLPTALAQFEDRATIEALKNELSQADRREYNKVRHRIFHDSLDQCHGECILRSPAVADIVAEAILHGNGSRYDVDRFVIMPNHVHVLAQFRSGVSSNIVGQSWLRYTARKLNALLGRSGNFWQSEPFDHIIRSPDQFAYLRHYVSQNPIKAKLHSSEYRLWPQV